MEINKSSTIKVSPTEFKALLSAALENSDEIRRFHLDCQFIKDERKSLGIPEHLKELSLNDFVNLFLQSEESLDQIKIWRKDRTERGYYRYNIAVLGKTGNWCYPFEITEDVGDTEHIAIGPGLIFRTFSKKNP